MSNTRKRTWDPDQLPAAGTVTAELHNALLDRVSEGDIDSIFACIGKLNPSDNSTIEKARELLQDSSLPKNKDGACFQVATTR